MIINDENIQNAEMTLEKARAILIDEDNKYILCEINESLFFPGGTVEDGEDYHITIIRELKEEVGIDIDDLEELITIRYYHKNFPNLKIGTISDRLNIVHYFYKKLENITFGEKHLTQFEIENKMRIKKYTKEELRKKIKTSSLNNYKKFTDRELEVILDYLDKNKKEIL